MYFSCINCKKELENSINNNFKEKILKDIYDWINSKELEELISAFNSTIPKHLKNINYNRDMKLEKLIEKVEYILKFSDVWDYRAKMNTKDNERPRWLIDDKFDKKIDSLIQKNALKLGLVNNTQPLLDEYDFAIVLGGARLSNLDRANLLKSVLKSNIKVKAIVGLSTFREILESEKESIKTYAKNAKYEYDLMNSALEGVFNLKEFEERKKLCTNIYLSCAKRKYISNESMPYDVYSFAGNSSNENKRANSADTFKFLFENMEIPKKSKILLLSTQIYVNYQQLEALRMLGFPKDLYIETIGYGNDFRSVALLQEIRSTIQAIDRLLKSGVLN